MRRNREGLLREVVFESDIKRWGTFSSAEVGQEVGGHTQQERESEQRLGGKRTAAK